MNTHRVVVTAAGMLLASLACAFAAIEVPRIAIIAAGDAAAFGDVLTAQLSADAACHLVERAELERLSAEAEVQKLALSERPFALARLVKADGLVFVSVDATEAKQPVLVLRLAGPADGRVRHGLVLPWLPKEMETNAKLAAVQLKHAFQQLIASGSGPQQAVSLLGLRATVDSSALRSLETRFNILLAHRLAQEPGLSVLERWRMDDLMFERALAPLGQPPLIAGAMLVDGSIESVKNLLRVRVRLRKGTADVGVVHVFEKAETQMDEIIHDMVLLLAQNKKIKQQPAGTLDEARSYAALGRFLVSHDLAPQAAQAIESAVALGDDTSATLRARVEAYAVCAYRQRLGTFSKSTGGSGLPALTQESATFRVAAVTRAVVYATDLLDHSVLQTSKEEQNRTAVFAAGAFNAASRVLWALHEARLPLRHEMSVVRLRTELRSMVAPLDQSVIGQSSFWNLYKTQFAPCWCATMTDTLKYYRHAFSPVDAAQMDGGKLPVLAATLREDIHLFSNPVHGPFIDNYPHAHDVGIPRLLDWDANDDAQVTALWSKFIKEPRLSPDLLTQADGLRFEFASHHQWKNRARILDEVIAFLWKNREHLVQKDNAAIFASLNLSLQVLNQSVDAGAARISLIKFILYCLNEGRWVPPLCVRWIHGLIEAGEQCIPTMEEARQLTAALDRYEKRAAEFSDWTSSRQAELMRARSRLRDILPAVAPPSADTLRVHLWNLYRHLGIPRDHGRIDEESVTCSQDQIWFHLVDSSKKGRIQIVAFNPATLQAKNFTFTTPKEFPSVLQILPVDQTLWVAESTFVWHCDMLSNHCTKLDLPERTYTLRAFGGKMIAAAPPMRRAVTNPPVTGLAVAEVTPQGSKWIVSSRRRPQEHPLDSLDIDSIFGLFPGTNGVPWLAVSARTRDRTLYSLDQTRGQKPELVLAESFPVIKEDGDKTLIYSSYVRGSSFKISQVWLMGPQLESPILLLKDPDCPGIAASQKPRWQMPEVLLPSPGFAHAPVLHGDELWVLKWDDSRTNGNDRAELVGLLPGAARPVVIPLRLAFSPEDSSSFRTTGIVSVMAEMPRLHMERDGLMATSYGLVFGCEFNAGIWIVPWEDIRAWIKAHPSTSR